MLIIAPVCDAPTPTYTCGICGFVMSEVGECPRCKLQAIEFEREVQQRLAERTPDVFEQVRELLDGEDNEDPTAA
jgi:primosomal protein N'